MAGDASNTLAASAGRSMALALDGSHFNPATVGCGATAATAVGAADVDACWHRGNRIVTGSMI
jgi:hypothetical protein